MYQIGLFSRIAKTTIKTLRYYDKIGLLKPSQVNGENNYRYYTTEQLYELQKIMALKQMGFSIGEIFKITADGNVEDILISRKEKIINEMALLIDQLSRIEYYFIENKEGGFFMDYQALIKETPECIVYCKKMKIKDYDSYFKIIPMIGREVTELNPGLKLFSPEYCFIEYLDGEYKEKNFNIEFCEAVTQIGKETDEIKFKELPGIFVVSTLHKGGYESLGKGYSFLFSWLENNNYSCIGNPREAFIDGIWNKEKKEDWLTEIQIPVKKNEQ